MAWAAAITAGIVSSVIVLALQFLVVAGTQSVSDLLTQRRLVRGLWRLRKAERIFLVTGSVESLAGQPSSVDASPVAQTASSTAYLAAPDAQAAGAARLALDMLFPRADVVQMASPEFPRDLYSSDVVTVGGPINNRCTREFLASIPGITFDGLTLVTPEGTRFEPAIAAAGSPATTDYGLVVSVPNPFDSSRRWIVIAGCDTGGVLAAAMTLSPTKPGRSCAKAIRKELGWKNWTFGAMPYFAVVKTLTAGNIAGNPQVIAARTLQAPTTPPPNGSTP